MQVSGTSLEVRVSSIFDGSRLANIPKTRSSLTALNVAVIVVAVVFLVATYPALTQLHSGRIYVQKAVRSIQAESCQIHPRNIMIPCLPFGISRGIGVNYMELTSGRIIRCSYY